MAALLHGSQHRENRKLRFYLNEPGGRVDLPEKQIKQKHHPIKDTTEKLD